MGKKTMLREVSYPNYGDNCRWIMYYELNEDNSFKEVSIENKVSKETIVLPFIPELYMTIADTLQGTVNSIVRKIEQEKRYEWESQYSWDKDGKRIDK